MKVILCTGSPDSGHEQVFELLVRAGVASAQPASQGTLTPQVLQAQLLMSQEVDLGGPSPLAQVLPGKLWGQLATDLFLANISCPLWGWADHQTAVLMDFWQDFDPQVRLVLVYSTPQDYLAQVLDLTKPPAPEAVATAIDRWMRWNIALLRYYYRHTERCVLVNNRQAIEQPQTMLSALATQWQISDMSYNADSQASAYGHLLFHLINELINPQHAALELWQELDCAALLPSLASTNPQGDTTPNAACSDWASMHAQLVDLAQSNSKLLANIDDSTRANAQLESQLADSQRESGFLLLQLHEVQEELEHYFILYQEFQQRQQSKASGFVTDFWLTHQPAELLVDMRHEVVGDNWYSPELDGCWAGPELVSSVQLPPLQAGNYTLTLDVVDAMRLDIVQDMVLEAFGQSVGFEVESLTEDADYPLVCKAQLCFAPDYPPVPWHISLRFTHVVSPAEIGADDHRNLAIRLQALRLSKNI